MIKKKTVPIDTSEKELFGLLNGKTINSYRLSNSNGMQLKVMNYGATITELKIPLKNGDLVDVVLGFNTLDGYLKSFNLVAPPYFGAMVGRYAGRINNSTFNLNGERFQLNSNNKNHSIHGGKKGFSQKKWTVEKAINTINSSVTLTYSSPAGEENYPGKLSVELTYTISESDELIIECSATTTQDTIVNLTNHSYFNLDGHQAEVSNQELTINAQKIVETTEENIPTGRYLSLKNNDFDFRFSKKCATKIDNTFVLQEGNEFAASLFSKKNKLKMDVFTNQPAVHVYVGGNCFNIIKGKQDANYHSLSGICFETQNFPDAPNHDHFPSSILRKGDRYLHKTIYKFESF